MIIPSRKGIFDSGRLEFPAFIRAPLGLREGVVCHMVMDQNVSNRGRFIEITTTTINPEYWTHLWRIEIITEDKIGNSALLFRLLESRSINILTTEGSIHWSPQYHSTNLVVSLRQYASDIDGTTSTRSLNNTQNLRELEREIVAYFGDQIAIPSYKNKPLVAIKKLNSYHRISDCITNQTAFTISGIGISLRSGGINLPSRALNHINDKLGSGDIHYSSSVDTKTKLIRTLIYNNKLHEKSSIAIIFNCQGINMLSQIFESIKKSGFNIVQQQTRFASYDELLVMNKKYGYDKTHYNFPLRRLDALVEMEDEDGNKFESLIDNFKNKIESLNVNSGSHSFAKMI